MPLINQTFSQIITFTRSSGATYFDATGTLQTAATDVPRFDYNPSTLAAQGLLIEEQRTNLMLYSEQFDNAFWGPTAGTVTANATTAPSGAVTADRGVTNGVNFQVIQAATITSGATVSGSVFLKADGINEVELVLLASNNTTPYGRATFNVSTGVISTAASTANGGTNVSASITAINNGWYRCVVTVTYPATTSAGMRINAPGATGGIFLWGAQLEAGAFPTSYIPTTTMALTRNPDQASVNTLSPWFNSTTGTIYVEFLRNTTPAASTFPQFVNIDDGSVNNRLALSTNSSRNLRGQVAIAGVFTTIATANAYTEGAVSKLALGYQALNHAVVANGGTAATDTSVNVPSGLTTMRLGDQSGGAGNANGWLRRIVYYPRRLSNAELVSITS